MNPGTLRGAGLTTACSAVYSDAACPTKGQSVKDSEMPTTKIDVNVSTLNRTLVPMTHRRVKTPVDAAMDRVIAESRRRHEQQSAFLARVLAAGLEALGSKN